MEPYSPPPRILIVNNAKWLPIGLEKFAETHEVDIAVLDYQEIQAGDSANGYDGVILTGTDVSPHLYPERFSEQRRMIRSCSCPVLGICGGMQLIALEWGGRIGDTHRPIYGRTKVRAIGADELFHGLSPVFTAFSKHRYHVERVPSGFQRIAASAQDGYLYAMRKVDAPIYGVQFHPERRLDGRTVLTNFLGIVGRHREPAGSGANNARG